MIRKLNTYDQDMVLSYLYQDITFNIFIIGDIETYGMETEFQRVYGEFDDKNQLLSVFLRYHENAVYYSHRHYFNLDYLSIFQDDSFIYISGKTELMNLLKPYLVNYKQKSTYFCKAEKLSECYESSPLVHEIKTKEEASRLYDLMIQIDEFGYRESHTRERFIEQKTSDTSMGITLYIEEDDRVVASVATTAETTQNAMIVAVATHPNYRNKGYASILMKALMSIYFHEKKKSLCLFYDNPKAGAIYHRLGFVTIGTWDMYHQEKTT
ncbi:MAG: GNAT family N-acetyltransferase [Acholeplasma sp.]|nr:GNAT family N-acetyltransferase [Acholeplasma sp.]